MSEEQKSEVTIEQLQQQINEMNSQLESAQQEKVAVLNKNNELLGKLKKVKEADHQKELEAQMQAQEAAKKAGDFEQLFHSSEAKSKSLEEQLNALRNNISKEKVQNTAMKMASELADGANAELLSVFIAERLKYTDEGLKVTDGDGNLTVSSLNDLSSEFANSDKYKSLLRGIKSSGGGANGGGGHAPGKTMSLTDFESMTPQQKMDFVVNKGGKLED